MDILKRGLNKLNIQFTQTQFDALVLHIRRIELWNQKMNLVKADTEQLCLNHTMDCLAALFFLKQKVAAYGTPVRTADLGSGAGFPGIPLAVFCPQVNFDLVERSAKKAAFLENFIFEAGLSNVRIINQDFNRLPNDSYHILIFRAFTRLGKHIRQFRRLLKPAGCILAYKANRERIQNELQSLPQNLFGQCEVLPLRVPFLAKERNLVVLST